METLVALILTLLLYGGIALVVMAVSGAIVSHIQNIITWNGGVCRKCKQKLRYIKDSDKDTPLYASKNQHYVIISTR